MAQAATTHQCLPIESSGKSDCLYVAFASMESASDHFVLFADMLGFKALVNHHRVPFPENLEFRGRLIQRPERPDARAAEGNPLSRAFRAFHSSVEATIDITQWHDVVSIVVFSDSMFLASRHAADCVNFSGRLMRSCLKKHLPVRMGIGLGSFVRYGFSQEENPYIRYSSSQFFGSGVVEAYEAEESIKGMRIALSQRASQALQELAEWLVLPLPSRHAAVEATHELNYLPEHPDPMGDMELSADIIQRIDALRQTAPQKPEIQLQYSESVAAVQRMAAAHNR